MPFKHTLHCPGRGHGMLVFLVVMAFAIRKRLHAPNKYNHADNRLGTCNKDFNEYAW